MQLLYSIRKGRVSVQENFDFCSCRNWNLKIKFNVHFLSWSRPLLPVDAAQSRHLRSGLATTSRDLLLLEMPILLVPKQNLRKHRRVLDGVVQKSSRQDGNYLLKAGHVSLAKVNCVRGRFDPLQLMNCASTTTDEGACDCAVQRILYPVRLVGAPMCSAT